jgi:two-component system chemotaxis sensor kinase CheA
MAFEPGVSTREKANNLAGHGVGLDAVRRELDAVGYRIVIISERGQGTTVELVPSTHSGGVG